MSFWDKLKGIFGGAPPPGSKPADPPSDETSFAALNDPDEEKPAFPKPVVREKKTPAPAGGGARRRTTRSEDRRIEAEARELFERGDAKAAVALLDDRAILFARHEERSGDVLPCLCRKCLDPARADAEAQGIPYVRDFVVSRHHALFYWTPKELEADAKRVRHSMRAAVRDRLTAKGKEPQASERRNPFTGQMQSFPAPGTKRRANPFGASS